jgi:hypothetical protein
MKLTVTNSTKFALLLLSLSSVPHYIIDNESRDSSVSIATGYGLHNQWFGVRVPVGQEFSLLHVVLTGSGVHPASYPMGTGGPFLRGIAVGA